MNQQEKTKTQIEVMQAFNKGETIQVTGGVESTDFYLKKWQDTSHPIWDWNHYDYRIKPEPIEVTAILWINVYISGTAVVYKTPEEAHKAAKRAGSEVVTVTYEVTDVN